MPNRNPKHRPFGEPFPLHLRKRKGLVVRRKYSPRSKKERGTAGKEPLFGAASLRSWVSILHPFYQEFGFLNASAPGRHRLVPRENLAPFRKFPAESDPLRPRGLSLDGWDARLQDNRRPRRRLPLPSSRAVDHLSRLRRTPAGSQG